MHYNAGRLRQEYEKRGERREGEDILEEEERKSDFSVEGLAFCMFSKAYIYIYVVVPNPLQLDRISTHSLPPPSHESLAE